jgi:branched-chain amino acid transport system permease protein
MTLVQVIVSGLMLGAVYALFSSGLTLIWGMMNVVNFAHGDFVMLGMYTAVVVWTALGGGPFASVPAAAIVIATLGILSYFLLVRHIMRGPMLAQILGTFGLALFPALRAFWTFGADFKTLPDTLIGGSFVLGGVRFEGSRVLAGVGGLLITLLLHLILTRTSVGSRMLAVSEDATAAQLMGIRPQRMQALAWGDGGAAHRHRRRPDRHLLLYLAHGRRDVAIIAFVTVSFGGFGSVLGALVAGLIIGVVGIAVRLSHRPGLQGRHRLRAVRAGPVVPAARPDGQVMKRYLFPAALVVLGADLPAAGPPASGVGAHGCPGAAGGDRRLGVEHRRRLCRPGLGRPRRVLRLRRLFGGRGLHPSRLAADRRAPIGMVLSVAVAA